MISVKKEVEYSMILIIIALIKKYFIILFFAIVIFRVPMNGSYLLLGLSVFAFVFSTVNVGTFISTFAKNQQQAMLGGFIFLL